MNNKQLPKLVIHHGNMEISVLAELSKGIVAVLKEHYKDYYCVHRSFSGNEIIIEVKSSGIKA